MRNTLFTHEEWIKALEGLQDTYKVIVPVKDGDFHSFRSIEEGKKPDFTFRNTRLSPKSLIYPQSERMFEYALEDKSPDAMILKEASKAYSPQAIVGIRPCDAHAFQIVRVNFDNREYTDPWWVQRFEETTLVGLGCDEPCSSCFCTTAGCGPYHEEGLDVLLVDGGDHYLAKVLTPKGAKLMAAAGWNTAVDADSADRQLENRKQSAEEKITAFVNTDNLGAADTIELYNAPFWEEVSFSCINCGTCTFVCPTCWCFDIQDENRGKSGKRMRNWDSCMFPLFTLHGSGHNPRGTKLHRVRQRFMHKLKYYVDKYDAGIQCVGCGRCIRSCPVNIDIRRVCDLMNNFAAAEDTCEV